MTWIEVADGVFARRYKRLDQTLGLVVGDDSCLVIDTGCDETQGAEFAAEIRRLTASPWQVVITHAHFDHFFGTAAFGDTAVWAHERCRDVLRATAEEQRARWAARLRAEGDADAAGRLERARLVLPDRTLTDRAELDLGGRSVSLVHPGPAHTDHDVAVWVPGSAVLFAGDLVEQGAPPSVGDDAFPRHWPAALDRLLDLGPRTIVPGHGEPVGPDFVVAQRGELAS